MTTVEITRSKGPFAKHERTKLIGEAQEFSRLAELKALRDAILEAGPQQPETRQSGGEWRDSLEGANRAVAAEEDRLVAQAEREHQQRLARIAAKEANKLEIAAKSKTITGRVYFEADRDWLKIVENAGELEYQEASLLEEFAAKRIAGFGLEEQQVYVSKIAEAAPRHSAIHPGDFMVVRNSGGIYSVCVSCQFVRFDS